MMMIIIIIIIMKKNRPSISTKNADYIYENFLTSCFGRAGTMSLNTYIEVYKEEILHQKLFDFQLDLIFYSEPFLKGN